MKVKDSHEDKEKRVPTEIVVPLANLFEKLENLTLHLMQHEDEVVSIYFKSKLYLVIFFLPASR